MRRKLVLAAVATAVVAGLTGSSLSATAAAPSAYPDASGFQGGARHDGNIGGRPLNPATMKQKWALSFGTPYFRVSYPVVTAARVFVTANVAGSESTKLYALDLKTGKNAWGPVLLNTKRTFSGLATGGGRVYALDYSRTLQAFDAKTGTLRWKIVLPGQWYEEMNPIEYGGTVYAVATGSGATVYAVDGATGRIKWTYSGTGVSGTPSVDASGIYFSSSASHALKLSFAGKRLWEVSDGGSTPMGASPTLVGSRMFTRQPGIPGAVFSTTNGALLRRLPQYTSPVAVSGSTTLSLVTAVPGSYEGVLTAADVTTGAVKWRQAVDHKLQGAPVVSGNVVYTGSLTGWVYGLDVRTGKLVWRGFAGYQINPSGEYGGLTAGASTAGGYLIVTANHRLVAFG